VPPPSETERGCRPVGEPRPLSEKAVGSEYPAVIIPVLTQHYAMLQRNLLYTGVTRGKRLVVLVGQKKAIAIAVRSVSGRRRWSKLDEWLRLGASRRSFDAPTAGRGMP
jgi:UvrD-like helicase C-terminal domain